MMTVIVALILLLACVAVIYLLLKNMGEHGVEIAAPGSCKRGRCGVPQRIPEGMGDAEAVPPQVAGNEDPQDNPRA